MPIYVAGACIGALFFGQLTDRFGRKKLFLITLGVYTVGTVLTAFSMNPTWYFACRFLTGAGIGGEYAAINSAIDELIPAKYRGRVDVAINGSFWIGAAGGALLTIPLLDPTVVAPELGWRLAFGLGAILAVGILIVRRNVPESPRWLFIHGREDEGEKIVREIEDAVQRDRARSWPGCPRRSPSGSARRSRSTEIARTVFTLYPRRTVLCLALFIGQAFLYNAFFFTYGDTLTSFLGVEQVGWYIAVFAVSNFIGAAVLGPLFDTVGRVKMLTGTYVISGALLAVTGLTLDSYSATTLTLMGCIIFFFASAGASAAYLTASEVFPMETRALCIAFFYAVGTAAGGIAGPLLFGKLIDDATTGGEGIIGDRPGLLHRRGADDRRRHRGGVPRGQGRGEVAGVHRPAAHRGGRHHRRRRRRRRAGQDPAARLRRNTATRSGRAGDDGRVRARPRRPPARSSSTSLLLTAGAGPTRPGPSRPRAPWARAGAATGGRGLGLPARRCDGAGRRRRPRSSGTGARSRSRASTRSATSTGSRPSPTRSASGASAGTWC